MSPPLSARPRPARPRRTAIVLAFAPAAAVLLLATSSVAAQADSTPAPRGATAAAAQPCPAGETRTAVTASPLDGDGPTSPNPAVTTRADGSTVTSYCALAQPVPFAGPVFAPEDAVGGPQMAKTGVIVDGDDVPAPPNVTDVSWVISDLDTGAVLAAKNPHALLLPASTLKTLTALVVLPALKPTTVVRASDAAVAAEGTRVGLVAGAPYTVDQLFYGLVLVSGNDTAYALADAYGGRAKTLAAMNAEAARLGAWDTVARDPSGLDATGQRSSAYDLSLFGRALMKSSAYQRYAATRTYTFPGGTDALGTVHAPFAISNHNLLLENYPGTFGVKNGYTSGARHTFIGAVKRGGRSLLISEMGGVVVPSWKPSADLLDWAFAHYSDLTPVGTLVAPGAPQPPEWRSFGAGRTSTPTLSTPSPATTSISSTPPLPTLTTGVVPAPTSAEALAAPGGEPVLLTAAVRSPISYVVLVAVGLTALGGWLVSRRRRRHL